MAATRDRKQPANSFKHQAEARLLLLFGTPRSGTTWLGKIFDSHPLTLYKHEPDRSLPLSFAPSVDEAEKWRIPVESFVRRLSDQNSAHTSARLPVFSKSYRSTVAQPVHRLSVFAAGGASSLGWKLPVLQCADLTRPGIRVVWKSTDSLGRLGVIARLIGQCRIIHIVRHPCGYIASVLRGEAQGKFLSSVRTSEDYGIIQILIDTPRGHLRKLTVEQMRRLHPVERMAWIWVLLNEKAEDDTAGDPRRISVCYEDVCRDPFKKARELFSFCGLDWNLQTEGFIKASTQGSKSGGIERITQESKRYYSIFRDPLQSAEKWKSEMKAEDVERVYRVLRQSDLIRLYPESELARSGNNA
jgi:hypothetical protein